MFMRKGRNYDNGDIVQKKLFPIITGLFFSLVLNFIIHIFIYLNQNNFAYDFRIILINISNWALVVILIIIIVVWEKSSLASIGIKKISFKDFKWGLLVLILGFFLFFISDFIINSLNLVSQSSETKDLFIIPISIRILMVITAGITEEIIFRGYLIERIDILSKSIIFSSIFSLIAFTVFHIPFWGIVGAIQVGIWAIPITIFYIRFRNLTICMIVHILYDAQILIPFLIN